MEHEVECVTCLEKVAYSESKTYGAQRQCAICQSNGKRMSERCSRNPQMKQWWKSLSKADKTQWYQTNRKAAAGEIGTYARRKFEMPTYNESESSGARTEDTDIDAYIPYAEYAILKSAQGLNPNEIEQAYILSPKPGCW